MPNEPTVTEEDETHHVLPRKAELESFANALPLRGVEIGGNRVFNIWGESGVGKSSFISEFRESRRMSKEKVLWIQPTRDGPLDDIPEFIRACAKSIRYPANPAKEKKISEQLESAERGKVNPIVSDDSILITRSSIAKQKKAYINQAAASSVGRTEVVRDDFEINVGLGESKANNQAEGFLDALPLKALGTDLTIIYIEHYHRLSVTIMDWLRDYVFPAATKGAYRRSLVLLLESYDPLKLAYPAESWGEWADFTHNIRLHPLATDDAYRIALSLGAEPEAASYLQYRSLGYPGDLYESAQKTKDLDRSAAQQFLDTLDETDQLKIAALSLPQSVHVEDIASILGDAAKPTFEWFRRLPTQLVSPSANGKTLNVSEALRCEAISRFKQNPTFQAYAKAWQPMGRIIRNIPSRNERAKLFLLSGLYWIDQQLCASLFKEQANKILPFIIESNKIFNRQHERYCISERFRSDLREAALSLKHPGIAIVLKKATALWQEQQDTVEEQIAEIRSKIESCQGLLDDISRSLSELYAQRRIQERTTEETGRAQKETGFFSKFLHLGNEAEDPSSPEAGRKLSQKLTVQLHEKEREIDDLELELQKAQDALKHPYIALDPN